MTKLPQAWGQCTPATRLSLIAAVAAALNPWVGLCLALVAAWLHTRATSLQFDKHRPTWYFAPVVVGLAYLSQGYSLPSDDLMRHLSAWQLNLDYRAQYPWSDIPKANLWLGFDFTLGVLQHAGLSKPTLLQWLPAVSFVLQAAVLYGLLQRALPPRHSNSELFLIAGALGMFMLTPRSMLGRPEMFLLIYGATAGLVRTRSQLVLWGVGYLVLIPFYWLGWVYAPMALLIGGGSRHLVAKISFAALLGGLHLTFWQWYTGDYVGLLLWLRSTLNIVATENAPLLTALSAWFVWLWLAAASYVVATMTLNRIRLALPVLALLAWFALPNQIRYVAAAGFVSIPWLYRYGTVLLRIHRIQVPSIVVVLALSCAAALTIQKTEEVPKFELEATARVYSESPYATVFYGQPGIAVEPSFALGATKPQWRKLIHEGQLNCDVLMAGTFTHVIEKSLNHQPSCGKLLAVQGPWRLWQIMKGDNVRP